jgi:hypothetical protein
MSKLKALAKEHGAGAQIQKKNTNKLLKENSDKGKHNYTHKHNAPHHAHV